MGPRVLHIFAPRRTVKDTFHQQKIIAVNLKGSALSVDVHLDKVLQLLDKVLSLAVSPAVRDEPSDRR